MYIIRNRAVVSAYQILGVDLITVDGESIRVGKVGLAYSDDVNAFIHKELFMFSTRKHSNLKS